jgi:CheY-like chemotaxis protein
MPDKLTILCVDDDPDTLFITKMSLELDNDIRVKICTGVNETMAVVAANTQIDCILIDVRMPEIDGTKLIANIWARQGAERTPAIFLTGSVREVDAQSYLALGALGMIAKPFDPLSLASEVRRFLARY